MLTYKSSREKPLLKCDAVVEVGAEIGDGSVRVEDGVDPRQHEFLGRKFRVTSDLVMTNETPQQTQVEFRVSSCDVGRS